MMDNSQPEKECDYSFDVINNLPECIKEKILEYLPIKEAARTCILSKNWRHTWSKVHDLYIDVGNKSSNSHQMMAPTNNEEDLMSIRFIDQVLNLHNGNVHTLKISGAKPSQEDFERWMLKLSQMQIRKLILDLECKRIGSRPSCLVTGFCAIKLPEAFNGLRLLRSLHLNGDYKINETDMTKLISSCPLLEELMLNGFSYRVLKIHAFNLRRMSILGYFGDLYLQTPKLLEAFIVIDLLFKTLATLKVAVGHNLIQTLSSISHLQYLSIYNRCPDYLVGSLQTKNPVILSNLTNMRIFIRPSDAEVTITLFLFQNSPKLQELTLSFQPHSSAAVLSAYEQLESRQHGLFSCLRNVLIKLDSGSDCSIAFAKFILNNAPVLEKLIIWHDDDKDWKTSWSCELKRLSVTAEIIFKEFSYNAWGGTEPYRHSQFA